MLSGLCGVNVKKWLFFGSIFLFSPGCSKQDSALSKDRLADQQQVMYENDFVRQQEARLTDVPIPLNAKPVPKRFWIDEGESAGVMLTYVVSTSPQEIVSFYSQEMERFGWDQTACFNAHEHLLIFEKPGRVCSISLRPVDSLVNHSIDHSNNPISLIIFTGNKRSSV